MIITESGLISLSHLRASDFESFFREVQKQKAKGIQNKVGTRRDSVRGLLAFFEASTRTQVSFESAGLDLGMEWIRLDLKSSSLQKGESLQDTFENLSQYSIDFFVTRHPLTDFSSWVHRWTSKPVLSAGDGAASHPTQALLDAYTLWELAPRKKMKVAFWGDLVHSRVARSTLGAFKVLGHKLLAVDDGRVETKVFARAFELELVSRAKLKNVDIVYALRVQKERGGVPSQPPLKLEELGVSTRWMHPGPKIFNEDLAADLFDSRDPRSLVLTQSENGYVVRRVLLEEIRNQVLVLRGSGK